MPSVDNHYSQSLQADDILNRLATAYPEGPNTYQLAPIDQLHIGGIKASKKLSQRVADLNASTVLDVGSGLGGLLRVCQQQHNALYVSLDITHELSKINHQLNLLSKKNSMVITGNGQKLPFPDHSFDVIIMQHSLLNMPDKISTLKECKRVLSPNGHLILHEVLKGDNYQEMQYPVPWARHPELSHLISEEEITALINTTHMQIQSMEDWTEEALTWRARQTSKQETPQAPVVSPNMILGSEFAIMGKNVQRNLQCNAIRIVELVIC
ncbi:class I SAM-dependent methyltransferase [Neptunomonas japonica]|uniref:Methyltransferase n=1 Tax=Neptunomonas japonica JAMM 1380 TaxID=1441457 RepID=A0A7R6PND1_9GAMM|nr:class I SAM-dependent methyltransferase [Neptunomonas japonica]BBB29592.1 methyltransferase [Neptunomonas japonica JAMM 1380]